MIYSNPEFVILFAATLFLYLACFSYNARFGILIFASLLFYSWAGVFDTLIFFFVVVFSWIFMTLAFRFPSKKSLYLKVGILLMTAHLFFWKYASWLLRELQSVFHFSVPESLLSLPLPVGISFFTLQGIAYLVDIQRNEAEKMSFPKYLLFKSFFSQLVAGPIVRMHQLQPQLEKLPKPTSSDLCIGLSLFVMGFFKKVVLADRVSPFVDLIFAAPKRYDRTSLLLGLLGYTVQIWADFSGYTDMGRGTARMLGIHLPENFLSPYLAKSPSEFWRRWHITLSQWIRDYIYIPLGGNRGNKAKIFRTALLTMAISGLWHGANWTFLLWGLYHGTLLVLERVIKKPQISREAENGGWASHFFSVCTMFCLTMLGWLIFRAHTLEDAWVFLRTFVQGSGSTPILRGRGSVYAAVLLCFTIQIFGYYNFTIKRFDLWERIQDKFVVDNGLIGVSLGTLLAALFLSSIVLKNPSSSGAFIYFQF